MSELGLQVVGTGMDRELRIASWPWLLDYKLNLLPTDRLLQLSPHLWLVSLCNLTSQWYSEPGNGVFIIINMVGLKRPRWKSRISSVFLSPVCEWVTHLYSGTLSCASNPPDQTPKLGYPCILLDLSLKGNEYLPHFPFSTSSQPPSHLFRHFMAVAGMASYIVF